MSRDCVFCRIIAGEQHGAFVYKGERVVAFLDINQAAPGHTLVVPREHVAHWWDLSDEDAAAAAIVAKSIMRALREIFDPAGMLIEQRNGRAAGQEILHVHLHLIPRGIDSGSPTGDRTALDERAARIRVALGQITGSGETGR
jgi:histidine triad (HIT) family protein